MRELIPITVGTLGGLLPHHEAVNRAWCRLSLRGLFWPVSLTFILIRSYAQPDKVSVQVCVDSYI